MTWDRTDSILELEGLLRAMVNADAEQKLFFGNLGKDVRRIVAGFLDKQTLLSLALCSKEMLQELQ